MCWHCARRALEQLSAELHGLSRGLESGPLDVARLRLTEVRDAGRVVLDGETALLVGQALSANGMPLPDPGRLRDQRRILECLGLLEVEAPRILSKSKVDVVSPYGFHHYTELELVD